MWKSPILRRRLLASAVVVVVTIASGFDALAGPASLSQDASLRIDERRLYEDAGWLGLLAYRRLPMRRGWTSQADVPGFFLSASGSSDPRAEMLADAEAFFGPGAGAGGDADPRCRFPARYAWLRSRLGVADDVPIGAQCPALGRWLATVAADSVTINFASSYLESPSSMFGHTFLRFRRSGVPTLLSATSNYEADSSRNPGGIAFVVKGLFGGFPGVAEELPYHRRLRRYGDIEGRDVWEYPLRLDRAQIDLLLLALWETKDGVFDYFFVGENCSYRMLALLAAVAPGAHLLDGFELETVPIETIRVLQERGLVGEPEFRPSPVRSVRHHVRDFSADDLRRVLALSRGEMPPSALDGLPVETRARLLRAAAEYSSILIHRGELDFDTRSRVTETLLEARLALAHPLPPDPVGTPSRPDAGHGGRTLSLGWSNRAGNDAVELGAAGFRHERIDRLTGYAPGAEIEVFGARARATEDGDVNLDEAWLLRIESTSASDWLFRQPAWSLRIGAERKSIDDERPLVGSLSYVRGYAFDVGAGVLSLAVGASLDSSHELRGRMAIEAVAEATLARQHRWLAYELYVRHGRYVAGDESHRVGYGVRIGVPLSRQHGVVFAFERSGAYSEENEARVELRRFF